MEPSVPERRSKPAVARTALVALARDELRRSRMARFGKWMALYAALSFAGIALVLRAADGPGVRLDRLVMNASRTLAWLAGGAIALAVARGPDPTVATSVEVLAAGRGARPTEVAVARVSAAALQIALLVSAPAIVLGTLLALMAGTARAALHQLVAAASAVGFACVTGVTLALVAAGCHRVAGKRGRSMLALVVLAPWLLLAPLDKGPWSLPGALDAVLQLFSRVAGGVRA